MYKIKYLPGKNICQLHTTNYGAWEGSLEIVVNKVIEIGMRQEELSMAIEEMFNNQHNIAEFGVNGYFILTKEK